MGFVPLQGTQQLVISVSITDATPPLQQRRAVRALALRPPLTQNNPFSTYFTQVQKTRAARRNELSELSTATCRNMQQLNSVEKSVQIAVSRRLPRLRQLTETEASVNSHVT